MSHCSCHLLHTGCASVTNASCLKCNLSLTPQNTPMRIIPWLLSFLKGQNRGLGSVGNFCKVVGLVDGGAGTWMNVWRPAARSMVLQPLQNGPSQSSRCHTARQQDQSQVPGHLHLETPRGLSLPFIYFLIPKPLDPHSVISGSLKCSSAILINSYPPPLPLCPAEYTCLYVMP